MFGSFTYPIKPAVYNISHAQRRAWGNQKSLFKRFKHVRYVLRQSKQYYNAGRVRGARTQARTLPPKRMYGFALAAKKLALLNSIQLAQSTLPQAEFKIWTGSIPPAKQKEIQPGNKQQPQQEGQPQQEQPQQEPQDQPIQEDTQLASKARRVAPPQGFVGEPILQRTEPTEPTGVSAQSTVVRCEHYEPISLCYYCNGMIDAGTKRVLDFAFISRFPPPLQDLFKNPDALTLQQRADKRFIIRTAINHYAKQQEIHGSPYAIPAEPAAFGCADSSCTYVRCETEDCNHACQPHCVQPCTHDSHNDASSEHTGLFGIRGLLDYGKHQHIHQRRVKLTMEELTDSIENAEYDIQAEVRTQCGWLTKAIAYKPMSEHEVATKLLRRLEKRRDTFSQQELKRIYDKVLLFGFQEDLIGDEAFAKLWVLTRGVNGTIGEKRLEQELKKRYVADEHIEKALTQLEGVSDYHKAYELAQQRARRYRNDDPKLRERLYNFLLRRGYPNHTALRAIKEVLREVQPDTDIW